MRGSDSIISSKAVFYMDEGIKFSLYDDIMDYTVESAIEYFKDNYQGNGASTITWLDYEYYELKIVL